MLEKKWRTKPIKVTWRTTSDSDVWGEVDGDDNSMQEEDEDEDGVVEEDEDDEDGGGGWKEEDQEEGPFSCLENSSVPCISTLNIHS